MAQSLNPQQKLRVNGQLVETSGEELNNLAKKQGLPSTPTSPAGAAGIGASPDQSKMAGSRLQKTAVQTEQVGPASTLQGAQRTQGPRDQASQGEQQAAAKADKLKALGGLNDRVQGLVNEQLSGLNQQAQQPQAAAFNTAQLGTLDPTVDQDGVKALLTQYQAQNEQVRLATDPAAKAQAQAALNQSLADLKNNFNIDNPDDYLDLSQGRIGTDAAAGVINPDAVKMSNLDLTKLGYAESDLDGLLGTGWQNLSLGQFKQKIEDARQTEYARINELKGQLLNLEPGSAQRQLVERELRDLGQVGVTGVEQGMRKLQDQVNGSDQVKIAGKSMAVSDALKDDNISQMVADYLNPSGDPAFKKKLEAENGDFTSWINSHKEALTQLSQTMQQSGVAFGKIQEQQAKLAEVAPNATLSADVMKSIVPEWGKAVANVSDLSANGVYQAATKDPAIVNKLNADPTTAKQLADQGLTGDQIVKASKDADAAVADADLAKMLGLDPAQPPKFLTDPATLAKMAEYAPIVAKMRAAGPTFNTLLADSSFQGLIKSGQFSGASGATTLNTLLSDPKAADHVKQYANYQSLLSQFADIEKSGNSDRALQFLFGDENVSASKLSDMFVRAKDLTENDPFDAAAKKQYDYLKSLLGSDGKLDAAESKSLFDNIKNALGGGKPVDFSSFEAGGNKDTVTFAARDAASTNKQPLSPQSSLYDTIKNALSNDGKIDTAEILAMPASEQSKLFTAPAEWLSAHSVPTQAAFQQEAKAIKDRQESKIINDKVNQAISGRLGGSGTNAASALRDKIMGGGFVTYDEAQNLKKIADDLASAQASTVGMSGADYLSNWLNTVREMIDRNQKNYDAWDAQQKAGAAAAAQAEQDKQNKAEATKRRKRAGDD